MRFQFLRAYILYMFIALIGFGTGFLFHIYSIGNKIDFDSSNGRFLSEHVSQKIVEKVITVSNCTNFNVALPCVDDKIDVVLGQSDIVSNLNAIGEVMKFMMRNIKEDDEEFIQFVRTLIVPPSKKILNLTEKNKSDFSQAGQSATIDARLKSRRNGFFIESGGYNGEHLSNSLFFEIERNWTGLLIEPILSLYNSILTKNRNIFTLNACISGNKPFIGKLVQNTYVSGQLSQMSDSHKSLFFQNFNENKNKYSYIYVPCLPLYTILRAINVSHVDYFSLDVEGAEWEVLKNLQFDKITIDTLSIEWAGNSKTKEQIKNKMLDSSYELFKEDSLDFYFEKKQKN